MAITLEEYADALNLDLKCTRLPNQSRSSEWNVKLIDTSTMGEVKNIYVHDTNTASTPVGRGSTPGNAMMDYTKKIEGKKISVGLIGGDKDKILIVPVLQSVCGYH